MRHRLCVRLVIVLIGLWACGLPAASVGAEPKIAGKWRFFVGPRPADGRLGTLDLKREGDKLTGKVMLPGGKAVEIQGGKVTANKVSFFIQPGPNGPKIHHVGEISGDTIKGTTEFERPGQPKRAHFDWEAQRATD